MRSLPVDQREDPGLTMDRFRWRVKAKFHDGARDLMLAASTSAEALRVPELWAQMRVDYARLAMRQGDWALAERLAAQHFLTPDNPHYSDLEWLAGFAALHQGAGQRASGAFVLPRAAGWLILGLELLRAAQSERGCDPPR